MFHQSEPISPEILADGLFRLQFHAMGTRCEILYAATRAAHAEHGERLVAGGCGQAHGAGPHEGLQDFQAVGGLGNGEGVLAEGIFEAGGLAPRTCSANSAP